jgi:DNA repair exonuclease SbcCD ATPase subunit
LEREEITKLSRQELTRLACDTLAAEGKKPSINLVREWTIFNAGAKKGSDGYVQKDINSWFEDLLKLKRDNAIEGLPDAVTALTRDLWRLAMDSAHDTLASEKQALESEKLEAQKLIDLAQEDTVAAVDLANSITNKLALAMEQLSGRDATIRRLEESLSEMRALLASKEDRISGIVDELARTKESHAAAQIELRGLRKHALLQVEQARADARELHSEFERADRENKALARAYAVEKAEIAGELGVVRGKLSVVEDLLAKAEMEAASRTAVEAASKAAVEAASKTAPKNWVRGGAVKVRGSGSRRLK